MKSARTESVLKAILAVALAGGTFSGCKDPIQHYQAPKDPGMVPATQLMQQETRQQLIGAIVPWEETAWFFKLTGPLGAMRGPDQQYFRFLQTIRFEDGKPTWTLPEGWEQQPGSGMRFATIRIPTETVPLEVSVTLLRLPEDDLPGYILENVNRWRRQLGIPGLTAEQLAEQRDVIELPGTEVTVVNYVGNLQSDGVHGSPMGGMQMPPPGMPPAGSD